MYKHFSPIITIDKRSRSLLYHTQEQIWQTAQTLYLHLKIGIINETGALCTNNNPTADTAWVNCITLPKATTFSKIIIVFPPVVLWPDSRSLTPLTGLHDHTHWTHRTWTPLDEWSAQCRDLYLTTQPSQETTIRDPDGTKIIITGKKYKNFSRGHSRSWTTLTGLRDHTRTHHTWLDSCGWVISPMQRLLSDNNATFTRDEHPWPRQHKDYNYR